MTLADLRGRPVILAFYPAAWSPVCGDQIALYNEVRDTFDAYGAQLLGVSVDSVWCHRAFTEVRHLHFPLLADFHPKGAVSRAYGAYRDADGFSARALFVLDAAGVVRWSYVSPVGENPGADGILDALDAFTPEQRGALTLGAGDGVRRPGVRRPAPQRARPAARRLLRPPSRPRFRSCPCPASPPLTPRPCSWPASSGPSASRRGCTPKRPSTRSSAV